MPRLFEMQNGNYVNVDHITMVTTIFKIDSKSNLWRYEICVVGFNQPMVVSYSDKERVINHRNELMRMINREIK